MKKNLSMDRIIHNEVILKILTIDDADLLYDICFRSKLQEGIAESLFVPDENPLEFTKRLMAECEFIWTIRSFELPHEVIGYCALHQWDKAAKKVTPRVFLVSQHWKKAVGQSVCTILTMVAKEQLGAKVWSNPAQKETAKQLTQ